MAGPPSPAAGGTALAQPPEALRGFDVRYQPSPLLIRVSPESSLMAQPAVALASHQRIAEVLTRAPAVCVARAASD